MRRMVEISLGVDGAQVAVAPVLFEAIHWGPTRWKVEQWSEEACEFVRRRFNLPVLSSVSSDLLRKVVGKPEGIKEFEGNLLLNTGIQRMEDVLMGVVTANLFTNGNSRLGVGDSATAEAATQTDL